MKEKILIENPDRFVIFPIQHNDIWEYYKMHQAAFWTAEEIDLTGDIRDWENLSDNESILLRTYYRSSQRQTELLMRTWRRIFTERFSTLRLNSFTVYN